MIVDRLRNWLSMKFLWLGHLCLDVAVWIEPKHPMPPRRPPLELDSEDRDDGPQQMEMVWG